jgi:hypothetical protein
MLRASIAMLLGACIKLVKYSNGPFGWVSNKKTSPNPRKLNFAVHT